MQVNSLSLIMFFTALISFLLSLYIYKRIKNPTKFNLLLILAAVTIWALSYGLELATTNLQYMKTFVAFSYFGIATVPVLWLLFVARYTGKDSWLTSLNTALLFIVPLTSIILVFTNDLHYLFYSKYEMGFVGEITFIKLSYGIFWWIHVVYSYLIIIIGLYFLGSLYFRAVQASRFPVSMFIAGSLLPYIANIAYVSGFKPFGFLDITPIAFIAMAVILIYGDTVKKALDVTPLAYDLLFRNIPDAIFVVDTQTKVVNINPAAQNLLDYESDLRTAGSTEFSNPQLTAQKLSAFSDGSEISLGNKTYTVSVTPILSPGRNVLGQLIVLHDLTERKTIEQQLEQLSFNDQLTGLYNRRYFENELKRLNCSREHPIAVISADLDGLKQVNDNCGHAEGDRYLKACADLLKNNLRASDVLARVGGDEFALLLPRTGKADAESFIARVRQQVEVYNRGRSKLPLRISMGLSVSEKASIPLEEAFRVADDNMYVDKLQRDKSGLD